MSAAKNLKPWQPGQSGNPGGRPKLPDELRGIHSLSQIEVCKIVSKYGRMTRDELQRAIQDPKTPVIEMAVASIFAQSIKNGDYTRLAFLLDRAIGKPKEIEVDDEDDVARMPLAELVKMIKTQLPELEKEAG